LHVRTPYALNDPIAQFALTSDCESRLQRDYVVLLDPPALAAPVLSREAPMVTAQEEVAHSEPALPGSTPNKRKAKRSSIASLPAASPSRQQAAPPRGRAAQSDPAPRLVLSGRQGLQNAALSLRFDTNLPDLNRPHPESLNPDELSDENTALTRKLAYLEAQLVDLQNRNTAIETKRSGGPTNRTPPPASQSAQWPLYLLVIGLLVATAGLIVLPRRRGRTTNQGQKAASPSSPAAPLLDIDTMASEPWTQPPPGQIESPPKPERIIEFVPSTPDQATEVKDDILDQAEVYMAHGHGDLAIHLLQEHLREAPEESPVPWLLLLDLLHREGDTESYSAASNECRRYFNINLSGHPISQDSENSQGLEAYPHLLEQLVAVWGSPKTEDFFRDLIFDKRGGTRIGFEPGAYRDILLLRAIAQDVLPLAA